MPGRKAARNTNRRVVAYTRVSTDDQAEQGHSLEAQRRKLHAIALAQERSLDEVYCDDGYSGGTLQRPHLQRLLGDVRAGRISTIYIAKLDRLSRRAKDLYELVELFDRHDVALVSASETLDTKSAAGRLLTGVLAIVAEFERDRTGERTREVLADRRKQRKVYSPTTPFGWRRIGDALLRDDAEQEVLGEMRALYAAGHSYQHIADVLTDLGITPRGKRWYPNTVRRVLNSRMSRETAA